MSTPRIAGAPISWGVCEVPGWGYQLSTDRVLREMGEVGLTATELGPEGFLPSEPSAAASFLAANSLSALGGFTPVVLHDPGGGPLAEVSAALAAYGAFPARVMVLAAVSGLDGYDVRPVLDDQGWKALLGNLDRVVALAARSGVLAVLHPHVGTMVETGEDVERVLKGSSVQLCLDTGHLLIGGSDPVELARRSPERIAHVHLKDVHAALADEVRSGSLTYTDAVRRGMYRALGRGDIDIAAIVDALEGAGYAGWYVLEQDTILSGEPEGEGPVADVRASYRFVRSLLEQLRGPAPGDTRGGGAGA